MTFCVTLKGKHGREEVIVQARDEWEARRQALARAYDLGHRGVWVDKVESGR